MNELCFHCTRIAIYRDINYVGMPTHSLWNSKSILGRRLPIHLEGATMISLRGKKEFEVITDITTVINFRKNINV